MEKKPIVDKIPMKKKQKNTKVKLIDILYAELKDAGIKVKRDGWKENEHSNPPHDECEWLDIKLKKHRSKKKHVIHLYFTQNGTRLDSVEVWKGKDSEAKMVAGSFRPEEPKPKTKRELEIEKIGNDIANLNDKEFKELTKAFAKIMEKKKGSFTPFSGYQILAG
jgi:hypothetical protein